MLKGTCAICGRKKSMTVSDATIEAEGLKDLFKSHKGLKKPMIFDDVGGREPVLMNTFLEVDIVIVI